MKTMEQIKTKPKESEEKIPKTETVDVEFVTEGEKMRMDEEKERESRVRESFKLSAETEKASVDVLKENSDEILRDLAEAYYNENEDFIKQEAKVYNIDISREAKYDIVRNIGVFDQLKNKKGDWSEENFEKFALAEGYDELRAQLKSGKMTVETPALILNSLEISKKEIQEKLDKRDMKGEKLEYVFGGVARIEAIKKYNKIFSAQMELAEKIYGGSLAGEKEKKFLNKFGYLGQGVFDIKAIEKEKEQEVLKEVKEKIFGNDWKGLSDAEKTKYNNNFDSFVQSKIEKQVDKTAEKYGIDREAVLALMCVGYPPEKFKARRKFFRLEKSIFFENTGKSFSKKEFKQFIKDNKDGFEKEITLKAGEKASIEEANARDLFLGLKEKVSKLAMEPGSAQKEMAEAFAGLKEKMINEGIKKSLKKEEKTREQLERITKKFEGGKPEMDRLLRDLVSRKGRGLSELTDGDFDENFDHIKDFMSDFEIPTDGFETMDIGKKGKLKEGYKKNAKSKTGFAKFMIDFAESLLSPSKQ